VAFLLDFSFFRGVFVGDVDLDFVMDNRLGLLALTRFLGDSAEMFFFNIVTTFGIRSMMVNPESVISCAGVLPSTPALPLCCKR